MKGWGKGTKGRRRRRRRKQTIKKDPQGINLMELSDTNYAITILNIFKEIKHKIRSLAEPV